MQVGVLPDHPRMGRRRTPDVFVLARECGEVTNKVEPRHPSKRPLIQQSCRHPCKKLEAEAEPDVAWHDASRIGARRPRASARWICPAPSRGGCAGL